MLKPNLICLIPVHNEASHLTETLKSFESESPLPIKFFVLSENGSVDSTRFVLKELQSENYDRYTVMTIPKADQGLALRTGLQKICEMIPPSPADHDQWIQINAADIPFGTSDMRNFEIALKTFPKIDMILGSKFHPDSQASSHWSQSAVNRYFYGARKLMIGLKFRDTRGTLFLRLSNARKMVPTLFTTGPITTTEMVYWHHIHDKHIMEVPVKILADKRPRSTQIIRNGIRSLRAMYDMRLNRIAGKYK